MALFYYQALERNGRKTKGMIEADSARHARQLLRGKELIPVHIEARMNTSSGGMLQRRRHAHRRVAAADLALFTRQLATLVQAAMPLETCLQAVSEQSEKLHVKASEWRCAAGFRKVTPCRTACANIPASLILCFVRWLLPEKNPGISTWCLIAWQITPNSDSA
ncbi:type II secretion system protein F [Escherichia coli]|nr:type II secretion system protein F [Escherichia coli]